MRKALIKQKIIGFAFVSVAGTLLHFVFDWCGQNWFAALFSAVNESVWEHMKLLYIPLLLFAVGERIFGRTDNCFWCVKLSSALLGLLVIPTLYYLYTGALGVSADWFNITIFFIAAAVSFFADYLLSVNKKGCFLSNTLCFAIFIFIGLLFVIFTFWPIHIPLFEDPVTKQFGMP